MSLHSIEGCDLHSWIVHHNPLAIVALRDDLDVFGHDPRSPYVERYWLPVLGPSCVLALRRLADVLETAPDGIQLPLAAFAGAIGLGVGVGRGSPMVRTLARLVDFGLAHAGADRYAVRLTVPGLNRRQVRRLPEFLAELHQGEIVRLATACSSDAQS